MHAPDIELQAALPCTMLNAVGSPQQQQGNIINMAATTTATHQHQQPNTATRGTRIAMLLCCSAGTTVLCVLHSTQSHIGIAQQQCRRNSNQRIPPLHASTTQRAVCAVHSAQLRNAHTLTSTQSNQQQPNPQQRDRCTSHPNLHCTQGIATKWDTTQSMPMQTPTQGPSSAMHRHYCNTSIPNRSTSFALHDFPPCAAIVGHAQLRSSNIAPAER
jgi:hypothetical protein